MKKIEYSLLQNAMDSITHAIDLLAYEPELEQGVRYKRAILSIVHGIELLMKERLRLIHPALLWENVDSYPDLAGRTVNMDKAILRLVKIGGLRISQSDEKLLNSIKKIRNAIEHYKWSISSEEAEYIIGTSLSFAVFFSEAHLNCKLVGYEDKRDGTFQDLITSNKHFAEAHSFRASKEYREELEPKQKCEFCKALMDLEENKVCDKCGHVNWSRTNVGFDPFDNDTPF